MQEFGVRLVRVALQPGDGEPGGPEVRQKVGRLGGGRGRPRAPFFLGEFEGPVDDRLFPRPDRPAGHVQSDGGDPGDTDRPRDGCGTLSVGAAGEQNGHLTKRTYAKTIKSQRIDDRAWTGIQITTAAGLCAIVDMVREGSLPQQGLVKMEQVDYDAFLSNRFGRYYA